MQTRALAFGADGLSLEGELILPDEPRWMVVLCHGIPSGVPYAADDPGYAGLARAFAGRGHAAMWFNFRGSREAPGDFSIAGWCRDLTAALDALAARADVSRLPRAIVGSSAGGAAAIGVAAGRDDVSAIATLAAPASFDIGPTEARALIQRFRNTGLIRDPAFPPVVETWAAEFATASAERHVSMVAPRLLLLVHGDADEVVPYPHVERLFERAGEPKELVRIPRGAHQLRRDPRAVEAVLDWLDRHPARPGEPARTGGLL